jgi:hypothetical protein
MAESNSGSSLVLIAGAGIAAYYFWPQIQAALGLAPATAAPPQTSTPSNLPGGTPPGAQTTNSSPSINTPGAVAIGNGCFSYQGTISCPPGVSPPAPATPSGNCPPGYTYNPTLGVCQSNTNPASLVACTNGYNMDAAGVCTMYTDAQLIAGLNTIQWPGLTAIPAEQIARIDPQIVAASNMATGITPGSVLAYVLGLGGAAANNVQATGSDGNLYTMTGGMWVRYIPSPAVHTGGGASSGPGMQGIGRLGRLAAALPVTNDLLTKASYDPATAAILGSDPRGLLSVPQWNYFYSLASGVLQTRPTHPFGEQGAKINATQYQALRQQAGLPVKLGSIRSARPGAFPSGLGPLRSNMGSISAGPSRKPFVYPGNRNIYRIPGQGAVPQKLGVIQSGGGNHRWARSPFPRPSWWRTAE